MNNLNNINILPKNGKEEFTKGNQNTGFELIDFWKWSVSDLVSNATRGKLAEFIVAMAIGFDKTKVRIEWDAYDLISPNGIKIEVKSAAYIQSWRQSDYSNIQFSIKPARAWDEASKNKRGEAERHADVYVMCLLKHKDQATLDPMKMEQWEFYVVTTNLLNEQFGNQKQISLSSLKRLANACSFGELKDEVRKSY